MKDITKLSVDLSKASDRIINKLKQAQRDTAQEIWEDVVSTAPIKTGEFISSINVSDTTYNTDTINTSITSDLTVTSLAGKSYNLGKLLETGTRPHKIVAINSRVLTDGEHFFGKKVNHPGTKAYNFYHNALEKNKDSYKERISKAIKEGIK